MPISQLNRNPDVVKRGTARRALALNRQDLAGKTGTTNDYVDAWFTGFNSSVATTVWVGFDNPTSMGRGEAGSLTALPIWVDYMRTGLDGVSEDNHELPEYIETGLINRSTGKRTDEFDPGAITEFFPIEHLTPEHALLQNLYSDAGDISTNNFQTESLEAIDPNFETIVIDDVLLEEEVPLELDQSSRIIEDEEDTEGLF